MPHIHIQKISRQDAQTAMLVRCQLLILVAGVAFLALASALAVNTMQVANARIAAEERV